MSTIDDDIIEPARDIGRLVHIMARLRDPQTGCPWDLEQDFSSIRNYTIEEAYEVADAIEREDFDDLREELGDLLLQPVYHAQMASERGLFDLGDVVYAITEKLIRRHPHVFGEEAARNAGGAKAKWDAVKADERAAKAARKAAEPSLLDDVPHVLPALTRAEKLSKRAASVQFDWPDWRQTLDKVREELDETAEAAEAGARQRTHEELGDLLFAVANLARKLDVDPEAALRDANLKFSRRFSYVEARAREDGVALAQAGLERLDGYWNEIRAKERSGGV
jgi:MazG family protein